MTTLKMKKTKYSFKQFLEEFSKKYDVNHIEVCFSGSGDNGEMDDPQYYKKTIKEGEEKSLEDMEYRGDKINITSEEENTIREFFDKYLMSTDYDWYNNDGGFGSIRLNLDTGEIKYDMNINETSYETYDLEDSGEFVKNHEI